MVGVNARCEVSKSGARKQMNYNSTRVQDAIGLNLNCKNCKKRRNEEKSFQTLQRQKGNGMVFIGTTQSKASRYFQITEYVLWDLLFLFFSFIFYFF